MRIRELSNQTLALKVAGQTIIFLGLALSNLVFAQANIESLVFSRLSGEDVQINIVSDAPLDEPGSFLTTEPPRIAFDFFGTSGKLESNSVAVNTGAVESIVAVETEDRTRVIVNLSRVAHYDIEAAENGYAVTIYNRDRDTEVARTPKPFAAENDISQSKQVSGIDFRRSEAGGGKLLVSLNEDNVSIDTYEKNGEIIVDVLGVDLPSELERRLDVIDFATPVQTIDAFQNADNVRLVISPQGKYQHLSYQAQGLFTLVVDPIIETEDDKKRESDANLGFTGERLSINFQKIDVRSALAVIADFTGINFVTSDSVEGEITINLKDVPWDQALDVIMRTKGLSKRQTGNVIWIAPTDEVARLEKQELEANAVTAEFSPLVSEVIQINYAKAKDIADVLKSIKVVKQGTSSSGSATQGASFLNATETDKNSLLTDRGSVTVDERTNSLLVQDIASKIGEVRNLITKLDKPVRQVMIETRIVEASDTFSRELGARLGFQRVTENARFPGSSGSGIGDVIGSGTTEGITTISDSRNDDDPGLIFDVSRGTPGGMSVDLGANGIDGNLPASYAFDIFRAGTGFANLITLELSALEADGKGKIVASPRLITANQKEAVIKQGEERVFTVVGANDVEVETKEAVLALEVTPQITPDDRVVLDVKITQDNFIPVADGGSGVAAALRKKEIVTQVLSDNGETIVIGGIFQEESSSGVTKVPILGDIPILGNLFKKRSKREARSELLIFLTPKIISPKLNLG
jgi:type IV pilus assembly protein PilQ